VSSSSSLLRNQCSLILIFENLLDQNIFNHYLLLFELVMELCFQIEIIKLNYDDQTVCVCVRERERERERDIKLNRGRWREREKNIGHRRDEEDEGYCLVEEK